MEQVQCRNCGALIETQFCGHCGQARSQKLSAKRVFSEIYSNLINFESRFLVTLISLSKNPGKVFREFINGRRQTYFSPIRYSLWLMTIMVAASGFMDVALIDASGYLGESEESDAFIEDMQLLLNSSVVLMFFLQAFVSALVVRLMFYKQGYSVSELYLPMLLCGCHPIIVTIAVILFGHYGDPMVITLLSVMAMAYMVWGVVGLYSPFKWLNLLKASLAALLTQLIFGFLLGFVATLVVLLRHHS